MTTLISKEPRIRVPHHPASIAVEPAQSRWRRILKAIIRVVRP